MRDKQKMQVNSQSFYGYVTAFCAPAIIYTAASLLGVGVPTIFYVLMYLLPLTVYLLDYFYGSPRLGWLFAVPAALSLLLPHGNIRFALTYYALLSGSILYPAFFKGITKKVLFFKDFFVALVWSILILLLYLYLNIPLDIKSALLFIFVFMRVFVDASYCDIKDRADDRRKGLKTVPAVLGVKKTGQLLQLVNILSFCEIAYMYSIGAFSALVIVLTVPVLINALSIGYLSKRLNYSIYIVDVEFFIWALSLMLARLLWKL